MPLIPTAGSRIYIGNAMLDKNTDFVLADFAGQTWVEITGHTDLGTVGDKAAVISSSQIGVSRVKKAKGVVDSGSQALVCDLNSLDPGQLALVAASKSSSDFGFKITFNDAPPVLTSPVTMTIATPGVVTWTGHQFNAGDPVSFSTTGALPTGLTAGTTYFVLNPATNTFQLAATAGGSAIATSGSQSGVHTGSNVPAGSQRYFVALVASAEEAMGTASDQLKLNVAIELISNLVRVNAAN